jgi:hypothetical protein
MPCVQHRVVLKQITNAHGHYLPHRPTDSPTRRKPQNPVTMSEESSYLHPEPEDSIKHQEIMRGQLIKFWAGQKKEMEALEIGSEQVSTCGECVCVCACVYSLLGLESFVFVIAW